MKKILSLTLCTLLLFMMAACGDEPQNEAPKPASEPPSSAPTSQPGPEPEPGSVSESQPETEMENVTFKDVTLSYPAGAEVEEQDGGLTLGIRLKLDMAALMIQVNPDVTSEEIAAQLENDETWEMAAQMMASSGGELKESAVMDFAGGRAGYICLTEQMNGVDTTMKAYLFSAGGTAYLLMTILADEAEEQYGDVMRQMVDSVEVNW